MILHDPIGTLDPQEQLKVRDALLQEMGNRTLIWALQQADWATRFDQVLVMEEGRVVASGAFRQPGEGPARVRQLAAAS